MTKLNGELCWSTLCCHCVCAGQEDQRELAFPSRFKMLSRTVQTNGEIFGEFWSGLKKLNIISFFLGTGNDIGALRGGCGFGSLAFQASLARLAGFQLGLLVVAMLSNRCEQSWSMLDTYLAS